MSETLWQKAYDEYVHENSYQGKLEKENKRLKSKLERIKQIIDSRDGFYLYDNLPPFQQIREVLEDE